MFKSQKQKKDLSYFFLFFILMCCHSVFCIDNDSHLREADSLFTAKKFTQAFSIYEQLHREGLSSPAMYLKMAYIREGLGDVSSAMLYLHHYYYSTFNKKALRKMELMANEHRLSGYEFDDKELFLNIFLKNKDRVSLVMLAVCMTLLVWTLYRKYQVKKPHRDIAVVFAAVTLVLVLFQNAPLMPGFAIVKNEQAIVMEEPSVGADLVERLKKGNKVKVVEANEAWVKVEINDRQGYIRDHNLLILPGGKHY